MSSPGFLVIENFLPEEDHQRILDFALNNQASLKQASLIPAGGETSEIDHEFRRAAVLDDLEEVFPILGDRLPPLVPHARRELGISRFDVGTIERQLTAHGDGDFFDVHTDVGEPREDSAARTISYVYYFHESPRAFDGGELRLYDTYDQDGVVYASDTFTTVEPTDNSLILFASDAFHSVEPVRSEGGPGSTRFTINGWLHDANTLPAPRPTPEVMIELARRHLPSFTPQGFALLRTPPKLHRRLRSLYDERRDSAVGEEQDEEYITGRPDFIDIDDIKQEFLDELQVVLEAWCGYDLVGQAAYGLRVYRDGQKLRMHVDRTTTHVISAIVHIAHETRRPWPLDFVDLAGTHHKVLLNEGEMLLYESARCAHGRLEPLEGSAYCSLFLHYAPVGWGHTTEGLQQRSGELLVRSNRPQ